MTPEARALLREHGLTMAAWSRQWYGVTTWHGDDCGCPDDRCIGFHHDESEDCGCLPALLRSP